MCAAKKKIRTRKGLRDHTYLGCPLTRNRSAWCYRLCVPDGKGKGQCGRVAPHSLKGEVALSIERHKANKRSLASHRAKLERWYLADAGNLPYNPGVSVGEREAEIVVPLGSSFATSDGDLYGSLCQRLLSDAANLAVNSIVLDAVVVTADATMHVSRVRARGPLIARGRVMAVSRSQFLAESVVVDGEGAEIGRGSSTCVRSEIALADVVGYRATGG